MKGTEVRVHRVSRAVDCGEVVNPGTVTGRRQGANIFGIAAARYGEVTLKNGRVEQAEFTDCRVLRMNETPEIEVMPIRNQEKPGGIGEPGTATIAPAMANAIHAATGRRLSSLPLARRPATAQPLRRRP